MKNLWTVVVIPLLMGYAAIGVTGDNSNGKKKRKL